MFKRLRYFAATFVYGAFIGTSAIADCDVDHTVTDGETIFSIAETYYGDHQKWSVLYYANQNKLEGSLFQFPAGTELSVPCLAEDKVADATPLRKEKAEMNLLTGSNFAPFTDHNWLGEGMVTELVNASLENSPYPVPYAIEWDDDWSKHLFPKIDNKEFDMGFPWFRPNCEENPDSERCVSFHFSEPLLEILILMFVKEGDVFPFEQDSDIAGKTICRPSGYFTHDLDRADRKWLTNNIIKLVQVPTPDECFELLLTGQVDAVSVNEFLGWTKVTELGLKDQVTAIQRPLSIEGVHVVISKKHWRGTTHLYRFNSGLEKLKESKRYDEIVSKHLGLFWDQLN